RSSGRDAARYGVARTSARGSNPGLTQISLMNQAGEGGGEHVEGTVLDGGFDRRAGVGVDRVPGVVGGDFVDGADALREFSFDRCDEPVDRVHVGARDAADGGVPPGVQGRGGQEEGLDDVGRGGVLRLLAVGAGDGGGGGKAVGGGRCEGGRGG